MALVVDTGPLIAALDAGDQDHERCVDMLQRSRERRMIPAPVLVEVDSFCARLDRRLFSMFLGDVERGGYEIEPLIAPDYRRVRELLAQYEDLRVGFVDAAVLAVVERLGERKLATLDHRHFAAMRPVHGTLDLIPT